MTRFTKQRITCFILLLLYAMMPIHSQATLVDDFPTETALHMAEIPPADLVQLTLHFNGITNVKDHDTLLYRIGDTKVFHANNLGQVGQFLVMARLEAEGEHVAIWADLSIDLDPAILQSLADAFDESVYDPVRALWGEEAMPGVDNDPRLHIVLAKGLGNGTGAYFARRHSYPAAIVANSNEHDMFFVNLDAYGSDLDDPHVIGALAHEFQHMIRANVDGNSDAWLGEGFSVFTEVYLGFPGTDWLVDAFMRSPNTQLTNFGASGTLPNYYGAALLFVTYFYDRFGEEALSLLSQNTASSEEAFNQTLSQLNAGDFDTLFADWVVANWVQQPDTIYGYSLVDLRQRPAVVARINALPFQTQGQANQYGTDYYLLEPPDTAQLLNIYLTLPESVPLLPTEAASGQWGWYSNRADFSNTSLSHIFDLHGLDSATLNYRVWYDIEDGWDHVYLSASADGGQHWTLLKTPQMQIDNPNGTAFGPGYTGESNGWIEQSVSLDSFAGKKIIVQFDMVTDDAINDVGLWLDDISLMELGYASDFEQDDGGWQATGFIRTDNRLPQYAWVQMIQTVDGTPQVTRWLAESGESDWQIQRDPAATEVVVLVSPFAPVTTVPADYKLVVNLAGG